MFENLAQKAFLGALEKIRCGSLVLHTPEGKIYQFEGKEEGPNADMILHNWKAITAFIKQGDIGVADSYRNGDWDSDDLEALMQFGLLNEDSMGDVIYGSGAFRLFSRIAYLFRGNSISGSKKNISAHYDLGNDFYSLWLDETMTYSSALFEDDKMLSKAQFNKYDRLLSKIDKPGEILEIGCGWGGFAERAISQKDHHVKGLTLSTEQQKYAKERLKEYNGNANIALQDYRHETKKFDNIVSIEMFEAVGEKYWDTYFEKIAASLKTKGKALVQTITIDDQHFDAYKRGGDMIRSFIFPGGMLPSPSRFKHHAQKAGLKIAEDFSFGQDYAKTLRLWTEKFTSKESELEELGFDNRFRRLWKIYLATCAASFAVDRTNVKQMELVHA